jgi:hypothetical protein
MTAMAGEPSSGDKGRFIVSADLLVHCCRTCAQAAHASTSAYENTERATTTPPLL